MISYNRSDLNRKWNIKVINTTNYTLIIAADFQFNESENIGCFISNFEEEQFIFNILHNFKSQHLKLRFFHFSGKFSIAINPLLSLETENKQSHVLKFIIHHAYFYCKILDKILKLQILFTLALNLLTHPLIHWYDRV